MAQTLTQMSSLWNRQDDDDSVCRPGSYYCDGGGWCCPTGYACVSAGDSGIDCSSTSISSRFVPSPSSLSLPTSMNSDTGSNTNGPSVSVSYITVQQPPQTSQVDRPDDKGLTPANIGGIVGGVVTLVAFLGVAGYIMRSRHGQTRRTRRKASLENSNRDISMHKRPVISELEACDEPCEVWDSTTQGCPPSAVRELTGSYEAHGISELDGNGIKKKRG
ncbi:hypothetical protein GGR57DRAFT_462107 [Xylariaceae sp. FL1272]|nr:hypothetical protein GGR57DRAFT_462107 [Xylariaceae sp. FL1272]